MSASIQTKQNKTKRKHTRPAPDVYIKLVRLFDPEGISFLILILFSIMDSTTYQRNGIPTLYEIT